MTPHKPREREESAQDFYYFRGFKISRKHTKPTVKKVAPSSADPSQWRGR